MKTRNALLFTVLLAGTAVLAGCATTSGNGMGQSSIAKVNQSSLSSKLVRGVTTEDQVRQEFGAPLSTSFTSNGDAIWSYRYIALHKSRLQQVKNFVGLPSSYKAINKTLTVLFDGHHRVRRYELTGATTVHHSRFGLPPIL